MSLAQIHFEDSVSIGNLFTVVLLAAFFLFIYLKTRKDIQLETMKTWIEDHEEVTKENDGRMRLLENAVQRLTDIQESMKEHLDAIDRRHERADLRKSV